MVRRSTPPTPPTPSKSPSTGQVSTAARLRLGGAVAENLWLTVQAAAVYASVSTDTIYTACERNELRHVKVGGRKAIRVRAEWVDEWLERHARGGPRVEREPLV